MGNKYWQIRSGCNEDFIRIRKGINMKFRKLLISSGMIALFAVGGALPALAETSMGWGHGGVSADHRSVYACDDQEDGDGVYVLYGELNSANRYYEDRVGDANGSAPGCTHKDAGGEVVRYRVCLDDWGSDTCSGWKRADE